MFKYNTSYKSISDNRLGKIEDSFKMSFLYIEKNCIYKHQNQKKITDLEIKS